MSIKPVECRDRRTLARLVDVWKSAVVETHTFLSSGDIALLEPEVVQGLEQIESLFGYYDEAGVVQGFIGVEDFKIEMLFVDAASRGRGIGKQLVGHVVERLGAKTVDANEQNEQAVGFYKHMGFHVTGRSACDGQGRPFPLLHLSTIP